MATPHRQVLVVGVSQHSRKAARGWVSNTGMHVSQPSARRTAVQQRRTAATGQWTFGKGWR